MGNPAFAQLTDDALFAEVTRRKAAGEDFRAQLGELTERWREPAYTVVRRVQGSFLRGSPDDQGEVFQEAVAKFLARGLAQFRGVSEQVPGKAASPKTFFLRIVKHVAIDRYRRNREELESGGEDSEEGPSEPAHEVARSVDAANRAAAKKEASEEYWTAFARLQREHPNEAAAWDLYHHQDVEDHEECARLLDISVANSYKRVSRAQAWLKLYLLEEREKEEADE
jgi:RNA polymerase sigma-70 factor, ECF subfamily